MPFYIDFNNSDSDSEKEVFLAEALDRAEGKYPNEPALSDAEPAVAEPAVAEPVVAEPAVAEPAVAEPVVAEPAVAEPAVAEPAVAEPVVAEPVVVESVAHPAVAPEPTYPQAGKFKHHDGSMVVWGANMRYEQRGRGKHYQIYTDGDGHAEREEQIFTIDALRKRSSAVGFARTATLIAAAAAKAANNQDVTQETVRVATKRPRPEVAPSSLPQLKYKDGSNVVWQSNMIHSQREGKNYIIVRDTYTGAYVCEVQVYTEQELNSRQLRIPGGRLG